MSFPFKPLKGVRILDLSRLLPGPFCSHLLFEFGAQVTVIDHPREVEVLSFPAVQKGKKRLKLDLKTSKGLIKFKELAKKSDVILEGFRPGVLDRLGIGFKILRKINPKIILCSLTGYGQNGGNRAGHDLNYLSISGMLSALVPDQKLFIPGIPMADLIGGMAAALKMMAALTVPLKSRKALHLDVSICDSIKDFLIPLDEKAKAAMRPLLGSLARYHLYETQDKKWLAVAPLEEKFWIKFILKMKIPSQILQEGEATTISWLKEQFKKKDQKTWLEFLDDPDLCVTPVL
jgi:alpha-methylacyl-CoA racemase